MAPTPTASGEPGDWFHVYTRDLLRATTSAGCSRTTRATRTTSSRAGRPRTPSRSCPGGSGCRCASASSWPPSRCDCRRPGGRSTTAALWSIALLGVLNLFRGFDYVPRARSGRRSSRSACRSRSGQPGTFTLMLGFLLVNLLVMLEVADRLSLKGELEVAREIQLAMLPRGTFCGEATSRSSASTRPANTVGGDFYDVLPLADGQRDRHARRRRRQGQPGGAADGVAARRAAHARGRAARASGAGRAAERADLRGTAPRRASSRSSTASTIPCDRHADLRQRRTESAARSGAATAATNGSRRPAWRWACSRDRSSPRRRRTSGRASCWCSTATESPKPRIRSGSRSRRPGSSRSSTPTRPTSLLSSAASVLAAVEQHAVRPRFIDDLTILLLKRAQAA